MKSDRDQPFGQHDSHQEHQTIVFLGIVAALLEIIVAAIDTPGLMGLLTSLAPVIVCFAALKQIDALHEDDSKKRFLRFFVLGSLIAAVALSTILEAVRVARLPIGVA